VKERSLVAAMLLALVASGCTDADPEQQVRSATDRPTPTATPTPPPPDPVSLPALMDREYDGSGLRLRRELGSTDAYRQHNVIYRSGELRISGVLNVPRGPGPHPALVLAHGYIDPDIYTNGQGMRRELDWLARRGFVTLHVDYRNHAGSDDDPKADENLRLGYTEDVINAVHALRAWDGPVDDERVGLVGRSMGGGVVYNVLTVAPGLVDAAVVFAPVSSDTVDNFERWIRPDPGRENLARRIIREHGEPEKNPAFWRDVSPRSYFDRVTEPILIHHGTSDDSCPIRWTHRTVQALEDAGANVRLEVYQGEEHTFIPQWPRAMERTTRFLRRQLS
jgi:dipeptidyl aminopeptidase/acylaminoacyl peptidase